MHTNTFRLLIGIIVVILSQHEAVARSKIDKTRPDTVDTVSEQQKLEQEKKPLDLSVPNQINLDAQREVKPLDTATEQTNLFPSKKQKRDSQPLQIKGQVFKTQDQETEKRKSFDGAGIVINLKQ